MRIGMMRHKVKIMSKNITQNAVGEQVSTLEENQNLYASMEFSKVDDSDSKWSDAWANKLVMRTRYASKLMETLNNKNNFKVLFQGNLYSIMSYESWNNLQKYITIYLEKDI
ncbi:hypothetical protein ACK3Z8_00790 [Aeromonas caviae]